MSDNPNVAMAEYRYPTSYDQILASILELPYFNSPLALWLNLLMATYLVGSVAYHWFHRSSLSLQVDEKSSKKGTKDGKEASTEMKENIINQEESSNGFANHMQNASFSIGGQTDEINNNTSDDLQDTNDDVGIWTTVVNNSINDELQDSSVDTGSPTNETSTLLSSKAEDRPQLELKGVSQQIQELSMDIAELSKLCKDLMMEIAWFKAQRAPCEHEAELESIRGDHEDDLQTLRGAHKFELESVRARMMEEAYVKKIPEVAGPISKDGSTGSIEIKLEEADESTGGDRVSDYQDAIEEMGDVMVGQGIMATILETDDI